MQKQNRSKWNPGQLASVAGIVGALATIAFCPAVTSGDGPVHIYYAGVLGRQIFHDDQFYAQVYGIRHLFQPYSLHYLIEASLLEFVKSATTEKILMMLALAVSWTGLARCIRSVQPGSAWLYAWLLPLVLTWSLAGGFYNFCLASGFLFHAVAELARVWRTGSRGLLARFYIFVALLVLSHPLPLLVLAVLTVAAFVLRSRMEPGPKSSNQLMLAMFGVLTALCAPAMIYDRSRVGEVASFGFHTITAQFIFTGQCVDYFTFANWHFLYRVGLILFAPTAAVWLLSGCISRFWERRVDWGDILAALACCLVMASPFLPSTLNGAMNGERRLAAMAWPLLCLGLAARPAKRRSMVLAFSIAGSAMTVAAVVNLHGSLLRESQVVAAVDRAQLPVSQTGVFLESEEALRSTFGSSYALTYWVGVRQFVARHDLLLNSPWLSETQIPVDFQPGRQQIEFEVDQYTINTPTTLYSSMASSARVRNEVSKDIDFALLADPGAGAEIRLRRRLDPAYLWNCSGDGMTYAICLKQEPA